MASKLTTIGIELRPHLQTVRAAAPYTATLIAFAAFAQSNVIVLSMIAGQTLVGEYTTISRVLLLGSIIPQLIAPAIVPASSRIFSNADPARYRRLTTASLRFAFLLAGAGLVGLVSIAKPLLGFIYGDEFVRLYPYLQLGALYMVFQFGSESLGTALTATGRQDRRARAIFVALGCSVPLFITLTLWLGVKGAVFALILSELILVTSEGIAARDLIDLPDLLRNLSNVVIAAGLSVALHFYLHAGGFEWPSMILPVVGSRR